MLNRGESFLLCFFWVVVFFFVCLFVCDFTSHSRILHSYGDVTITLYFELYSALMTIEQSGFFSLPHLLWHVYNSHPQGPETLTPVPERLAVELSLYLFLRFRSVAVGIWTPDCNTAAVRFWESRNQIKWSFPYTCK